MDLPVVQQRKKDHLYSVFIKRWTEELQGLFCIENEDWVVLKAVYSDFIMDGILLINKKYISSIKREEKEEFKEKVLFITNKPNITTCPELFNNPDLFTTLSANKTLIQIHLHKEFEFFVGIIIKVNDNSIVLKLLNPKGIWLKNDTKNFDKDKIRIIHVGADYAHSLLAYSRTLNDPERGIK